MKAFLPGFLYREDLKCIAAVSMLIDHVGLVFFPTVRLWRILGRIAFPIFCFLLAEGFTHTGSRKKYALRLALAALISEIPFDLMSYGHLNFARCSVLVTLLLGFGAMCFLEQAENPRRAVPALILAGLCVLTGDYLKSDYGGNGVLMILAFAMTADLKYKTLWRAALVGVLCWRIGGFAVTFLGMRVPVELFGLLSLLPIACYSGKKRAAARPNHLFYAFYPGHMTVLYLLKLLIGR